MHRMADWITTGERQLPRFVTPFAKSAAGAGGNDDDEPDDDDPDDEDEEDDDDLAELTEDELRAELKKTRESLSKASGSSRAKRDKIKRLNRELDDARKPKPKKDDATDGPDLDTIRHEAKTEGEKAGLNRAKKAEAKSSLLAAGVSTERVARAVGLLDLDELDLDDDGLDGIDDEIEKLKRDWPELFAKKRVKRTSVAGDHEDDTRDSGRRSTKTASERAAAQLLGKSA